MATAWATPRTWVTAEVVTSAELNTDVRDNISWLGTDKPSCRVFHSTTQGLTNATFGALLYNSEWFDSASMHSTTSNTSRITFPVAGIYLVGCNVTFAANATGVRVAGISLNGISDPTSFIARTQAINAGSDDQMLNASTIWTFGTSDYIETAVYQTSGGALNSKTTGSASPAMWAIWMGN
jgi:hypothetical protein